MSTVAQAALEKQLQLLSNRSEERISDAAELVALTSAMCEVARSLLNLDAYYPTYVRKESI